CGKIVRFIRLVTRAKSPKYPAQGNALGWIIYKIMLMSFGQVATFIPLGMIRSVENKTILTLAFHRDAT
ncbi:MAG: hypothetical protein LBV39_01265, partial [Bacteroidales bacterium]|nr:hypothetical protein [Bacteroidales bacterium]